MTGNSFTPKNINCLAGMSCPNCGALEPFRIQVTMIVKMWDDGSDNGTDIEWDDDAYTECGACEWYGTAADFTNNPDRSTD